MIRVTYARLVPLALLAVAACSGGGSNSAESRTGGDFLVLKTEPSDNATLFLNDSIRIDFSNQVDLGSVNLNTFSFQVLDQVGNTVAEPVAGEFQVGNSPGDSSAGRRLLFVPRLPTNDQYTNGGFRPGRTYVVQLVGGSVTNQTMLRDSVGRGLLRPQTFRFSTADGGSPSQLFRNTAQGGPRRVGLELSPAADTAGAILNKVGAPPLEIRLRFDQPLNPSSANVPVNVDTNPLTRRSNNRGRIYLEYDDSTIAIGAQAWIPADVELETNEVTGSTVVLRPIGVLPNNATIRVIVEPTLEDISGESNVSNASYNREFGSFRTKRSYESQFDCIVDEFTSSDQVDFAAAFPEPFAEAGPGYLRAGFNFEGSSTGSEFEPTAPETILNTDFTQVTPKNGAPYNVSGGVFNFRTVRIPSGRRVQGQGSKPMVWLVSDRFEVAGTLSVDGGQGTLVTTTANANVPKPGGVGVCGGGDGGNGSPSATKRDLVGGVGKGPGQLVGGGGLGGTLDCTATCGRGSGGGGGSFATQGDPNFKIKTVAAGVLNPPNAVAIFPQQLGDGGSGCTGASGSATRTLLGGAPGPLQFVDVRNDNNFWGQGIRFDGSPLRITGELALPRGGSGGGGGGDRSDNNSCAEDDVSFQNDASGGGGGGGAGVLIVKCLGPIIVSPGGRITANGGNGGGGAQTGSSNRAGGGGGGSGGMVILMSADRIEINARGVSGANPRFLYGSPTASNNNDFDFSISADGGVCVTDPTFAPGGTGIVTRKYAPTTGNPPAIPATFGSGTYDLAPLGGFGGMGVVQLMAPPGDNLTDGTNTRLDDNILFFQDGVLTSGTTKERLIGWRGFPNAIGQGVADNNLPVAAYSVSADHEGDIRPAPILLPTAVASRTRLRSKWIDTGYSARRSLPFGDDNLPRGVTDPLGNLSGVRYEFGGYRPDPTTNVSTGYANFELVGSQARAKFDVAVPAEAISVAAGTASYLGKPAYRIELLNAVLGDAVDRYSGYQAELLNAADVVVGGFRILSHTNRELFLSTESGALPATATKLRVTAKFFEIVTNGVEGPNVTYEGSNGRVPVANVRIGFAFHANPGDSTAERFPAAAGTFLYNLSDPAVQETIRTKNLTFVQWDVIFDQAYKVNALDAPLPLRPTTPRPELRFLRVPFRF